MRVAQLRHGDWLARYAPGLLFKRAWFGDPLGAAPSAGAAWRVRFWDRAATDPEKSKKKGDPDWTVGCLMCWEGPLSGKPFFVEDVVRFRGDPGDVWDTIVQTSKLDRAAYGASCMVALEQEPGGSGKFEVRSYISGLAGFNVQAFPPVGDKVARRHLDQELPGGARSLPLEGRARRSGRRQLWRFQRADLDPSRLVEGLSVRSHRRRPGPFWPPPRRVS